MSKNTLNEIWSRRSLIWHLALNDLKLRYRNSVLGFFWSFLEPLLLLTVLYFVFTNIFKNNIDNYALYLLLGIIMWSTFGRGTSMGMESILNKSGLATQTYLPREVLVISGVITSFLMLSFEMIVFFIFMIGFQVFPPITIIFLPILLGILFVMTLGTAFGLSAAYVYYRDLKSIWGVILQVGFYMATIIYKITIFPENVRPIVSLNPFVPLLDMSRDSAIYDKWPVSNELLYLLAVAFTTLVVGYAIFRKLNKRLVEEL